MSETFVINDQVDEGTDDQQKLVDNGGGWAKRNKYKLLVAGLAVVGLVGCVVALAVSQTQSNSSDQSISGSNGNLHALDDTIAFEPPMSHSERDNSGRDLRHKNYGYSNEGRQFAIAFPSIKDISPDDETCYFECIVTTREATTVHFDAPFLEVDETVYLPAGVSHNESFSDGFKTSGGVESKALYVNAGHNIVLQCAAYSSRRMDSFLALPYGEKDTEYYVATCSNYSYLDLGSVGFVNVVATSDDTEVDITCPPGIPECPAEEYTVSLNIYQVYSLYVYRYSELSGFHISSSHPVSVYAGSPSIYFVDEAASQEAFTMFAVPPLHQLGTLHYTPHTIGVDDRTHRLRIVATDNTQVTIPQYEVNTMLQDKEFLSQDYVKSDEMVEVRCSAPCLVIHCNKQHPGYYTHGFMMRLTPVEAYTDDIVFSLPRYFDVDTDLPRGAVHLLSIVVNQYPVTDLYLDGRSLSDEDWVPNDMEDYAAAMMREMDGFHHLNSSNTDVNFSAYVYGDQAPGGSHNFGFGSQAGLSDVQNSLGHRVKVSTELKSKVKQRGQDGKN